MPLCRNGLSRQDVPDGPETLLTQARHLGAAYAIISRGDASAGTADRSNARMKVVGCRRRRRRSVTAARMLAARPGANVVAKVTASLRG
jgi:hypothetical protein